MESQSSSSSLVVQVLVSADAQGKWDAHSLELLSDARSVAARCNAVVGAWALTPRVFPKLDFNELAAHGCRHVWNLKNDRFAKWSSEAIAAALESHRSAACRMILLPGTARGEEVAALLAEKLQTSWIPDALTFSVTRTVSIETTAVMTGGKLSRNFRSPAGTPPSAAVAADSIAAAEGGVPVVVTMRPGVAEIRREKNEPIQIEEKEIDLSNVPSLTTVEQFIPADPRTIDITFANRIVSAGRGTGGPEGVQLVAKFAEALHASLGASRMAVDLGWVPQPRQVGQTGRTVKPDLYVACGISGASHHLAGMRDSKHIVAINSDARAPIHDVAHLSLKSDLNKIIPEIVAALEKRGKGAKA